MTATPQELQNALDRAKIGLMQKSQSVFFTTIAFSLKQIWDAAQPTAYVDGVHMGWNPEFFMNMSPEERIGVMVHEACHIAYDHINRLNVGRDRDHSLFNQAADHVINLDLLKRGFKLPHFRLADPRFEGMATEEVYNILEAEKQQNKPQQQLVMQDLRPAPKSGGADPNGNGNNSPQHSSGMSPEELQQHVKAMIVRAQMTSKMSGNKPGSIPGEIELYLDSLLNPKLPWQTILRRYITEFNKNDYSWKRPNRRFFPQHYLPSLHSQTLQDMTFYVDISGSVEDYQFQIFVSEIAGVLKHMKPKNVTIVQFDTEIHHVDKVSNLFELQKIKFTGRGGTHIECILKHMEQNKNSLSLVFTDGGFHWPRQTMNQKILWLINDNPKWKPIFGNDIHFSTKEYK